jgi:hypothetical protein
VELMAVGRFEMAYVLQAEDSEGAISLTVFDRKQALAAAIKWATEGRSGIKIIGDGRIYTTRELARVIIEKE